MAESKAIENVAHLADAVAPRGVDEGAAPREGTRVTSRVDSRERPRALGWRQVSDIDMPTPERRPQVTPISPVVESPEGGRSGGAAAICNGSPSAAPQQAVMP